MCNFQVGQKVVCIDDDFGDGDFVENRPVKGLIYTVREIFMMSAPDITPRGVVFLRLVEVRNPIEFYERGEMEAGFLTRRFRPIVSRKTDISIFKAMLMPKTEQVPA